MIPTSCFVTYIYEIVVPTYGPSYAARPFGALPSSSYAAPYGLNYGAPYGPSYAALSFGAFPSSNSYTAAFFGLNSGPEIAVAPHPSGSYLLTECS